MINQIVPVVPVTKIGYVEATLAALGFRKVWAHDPGRGLLYAEFQNDQGISLHASESRGDGVGPVVVYFRVSNVDQLAEQAGVVAEDQTWHMREFWLRDADGNSYRFGQPIE